MLNRRPNQVIEGLYQAYFKSMGTAASLMNYSFIGLPGWFTIDDNKTAHEFMDILYKCLRLPPYSFNYMKDAYYCLTCLQ